jgi:hypothetical protein
VDEIDSAGDVGIDHPPDPVDILIEEGVAEADASVRKQGIDRTPLCRRIQPVDAIGGRQVGLHRIDFSAMATKLPGRGLDGGFVGRDQEVKTCAGAASGEFQTDAGGGTGDDGKLSIGHVNSLTCAFAAQPPSELVVPMGPPPCTWQNLTSRVATIAGDSTWKFHSDCGGKA